MNIEQMSVAIYKWRKLYTNEKERLVNGKENFFLADGINKNSFADFYRAFQKMLDETRQLRDKHRFGEIIICLKYIS